MAIDSEYDGRRFLIDGFEKSEEDEVKTIDVGNREKTVPSYTLCDKSIAA